MKKKRQRDRYAATLVLPLSQIPIPVAARKEDFKPPLPLLPIPNLEERSFKTKPKQLQRNQRSKPEISGVEESGCGFSRSGFGFWEGFGVFLVGFLILVAVVAAWMS